MSNAHFLMDVWSFNKAGEKVHPYMGLKGAKRDLYSVNFSSDTNNYKGMTERTLILAILEGKFKNRGTIRMLPVNSRPGMDRNAYSPKFYKGKHIKDFG